jgi:hypothetical protein
MMFRRNPAALLATASIGAALALAPGGAGAQDAAAPDASSSWADMAKCGAIANDAERHACTDEVLRKAGMMASEEARSREHRKSFGMDLPRFRIPAAHKQVSAPAVKSAEASPPPAPVAPAPSEDPDKVTVTVEKVVQRGDGKFVFTTTEGAVWRQVESDAIMPRPRDGQMMTVMRTTLGGYMCMLSKWSSFRCTRAP